MPITLVGMTRVFQDDLERGPPGVSQHHHHQADIQEIETVTSSVSEYVLSDDGIDEADFALDKGPVMNEEEEQSPSSLISTTASEPERDEPYHDDPSLDCPRTPAPEEERYSFLPSILVTEIDDLKGPSNSKSDPRNPKKRTPRMLPLQNNNKNSPNVSNRGAKGESDVLWESPSLAINKDTGGAKTYHSI